MKNRNDVLIFVSHYVNEEILNRFRYISEGFASYGDAFLVINSDYLHSNILESSISRIIFVSNTMINNLGIRKISNELIPGSNHLILLWFYLTHPNYYNYWNVEYDVVFNGDWSFFFKKVKTIQADFLSSHIQYYKDNPSWYWWNYYYSPVLHVDLESKIRSFNPIYRISNSALNIILTSLQNGSFGHHEVFIPTILFYRGFKIKDFGGRGSFVDHKLKEGLYFCNEFLNTMRFRPVFFNLSDLYIPNVLYHPLK